MNSNGAPQAKKPRTDEIVNDLGDDKIYKFALSWEILKPALVKLRGCVGHYYNIQECPDLRFSIATLRTPDNKGLSLWLDVSLPMDKAVHINYTLIIPTMDFNQKRSKSFEKIGNRDVIVVLNLEAVLNSIDNLEALNIVVTGEFKIWQKPPSLPTQVKIEGDAGFPIQHDLIILTDGRQFPAHKAIIQQKFTKLEIIFTPETEELHISGFPFVVVKAGIGFCYDRPIPDLNKTELVRLIEFANQYGILFLKDSTEPILAHMLDDENSVEIANYAANMDAPKLKKKALEYIAKGKKEGNNMIKYDDLCYPLLKELFNII